MVGQDGTIAEVINQYDASSEKVYSIGNSCNQKIESNPSPMGRLKRRYGEWEEVTSSPFILGVIKDGYKLPFKVIPQPVELKDNKSARDNTQFVYEEVQKLLSNGCIQEVESRPAVVNPLTVATNKAGKKRLVLDCRHLNDCYLNMKMQRWQGSYLIEARIYFPGIYAVHITTLACFLHTDSISVFS